MNNPNPFLPKGSLLENQNQRRSRLKIGVSCVLVVSVAGLVAMLIGGCKRGDANPPDLTPPAPDTSAPMPAPDTNAAPMAPAPDTNSPVGMPPTASNQPQPNVPVPPAPAPLPVPPTPPAPADMGMAAGGSDYTVAKGDSLAKIAKKSGVTLKALQAANPNVVPTKLKIGQKLVIPAGGKTSAPAGTDASASAASDNGGFETYTVKSGDTLHKIAKAHGTSVKAIQAANNLTTTAIKVGKKLKIPSKGATAAAAPVAPAAPATPPVPDTAPAPVAVPPPVNTMPAPAPAGK